MVERKQAKIADNLARCVKEPAKLKRLSRDAFHWTTKYTLEKSSRLARDVFYHGPGSWQALRTIYENKPEGLLERVLYPFTLGLKGSRDTRNRLETYTSLIAEVLERGELTGDGGPCAYLDLACGCSLGPIRAARQILLKMKDPPIRIKCSDIKQDAIEYSKQIAEKEGVASIMEFARYSISGVDQVEPPEAYDGVGTHGFIDYKTSHEAILLFKKIRMVMKPGAILIATNMKEKDGFDLTRFMMRFYGNWYVNHKTEPELRSILHDSGFDDIIVRETPLGHHYIATARKP